MNCFYGGCNAQTVSEGDCILGMREGQFPIWGRSGPVRERMGVNSGLIQGQCGRRDDRGRVEGKRGDGYLIGILPLVLLLLLLLASLGVVALVSLALLLLTQFLG